MSQFQLEWSRGRLRRWVYRWLALFSAAAIVVMAACNAPQSLSGDSGAAGELPSELPSEFRIGYQLIAGP